MRELLFRVTMKDCDRQTFRAGGKGGQNQNKRDTGVRIIHRASGAVGESREHRTQGQNEKAAFVRMAKSPKFEQWRKMEAARLLGLFPMSVEETVDEMIGEENPIVEYL